MHNTFWFGVVFKDFLFKDYNISSEAGLIATCLGLASLAIFLEGLKVYRASLSLKRRKNVGETALLNSSQHSCHAKLKDISIHTSWYTFQDILGYIVMLSVMSLNGYFTLAVILGSTLGYFIFGPWLMEIQLVAGTLCSKQQLCSSCVAKMEHSRLLASSGSLNFDSSTSETNNSLAEVAEGLACVMNDNIEERVSVEVHSHEHAT